jgi:hypothetical protein
MKTDYPFKGTFLSKPSANPWPFFVSRQFWQGIIGILISKYFRGGRIVYRFYFSNNTESFVRLQNHNFKLPVSFGNIFGGICRYPLWHRLQYSYPQNDS